MAFVTTFVSAERIADSKAGEQYKSSAQGLITLATYGVGMLIGFAWPVHGWDEGQWSSADTTADLMHSRYWQRASLCCSPSRSNQNPFSAAGRRGAPSRSIKEFQCPPAALLRSRRTLAAGGDIDNRLPVP